MYGIWFLVIFGQTISSICHSFSLKNVVALVHNAIVYGFVIFHCCRTHFGLQVVALFAITCLWYFLYGYGIFCASTCKHVCASLGDPRVQW